MGPVISRTWFVYARSRDGKWLDDPLESTLAHEDDLEYHMGKFRHKFFRLALDRLNKDKDIDKIYLYHGWRVAKCTKHEDNSLTVEFSSKEAHNAWLTSRRSHLGRIFDERYKVSSSDDWAIRFEALQLPEC